MSGPARHWYPLAYRESAALSSRATVAGRARPAGPIDPETGPRLALRGRLVTMDDAFTVIPGGILYIEAGAIVAARPSDRPAPPGFEDVAVVDTGGTIYPGLIELHNHLSYNALPMWSPVPRRYEHRGQWGSSGNADYRKLVSGPMTVIGEHRDAQGRASLLAPLVRYVECKCLLGGVTTSQGIRLNSNAGVQRFYRGVVRNVEQTDDPALSEAQARIDDVDAKTARSFLARLAKEDSCFLLHLSEGITPEGDTDSIARRHFRALEVAADTWAINDRFAGIHAAGLLAEDFEVLARHGGSVVWSPLSNLLLYGRTARIASARQANVRIGLGSDWSPSGSKNLLGELKVAWLYSQHAGGIFTARELVAMVTRDAAAILKWQNALGSLAPARRADLLVIDGEAVDPYEGLIRAKETAIRLVMVNGVARYGLTRLMSALSSRGEAVTVGGDRRQLFLEQGTGDPVVGSISLAKASRDLRKAFSELPALARRLETPRPRRAARTLLDEARPLVWSLALDELHDTGVDLRHRLPLEGPADFTGPVRQSALGARAQPLSRVLEPIELDPLTVADDPRFLERIEAQPNLPPEIREGLRSLY